MKKSIMSLAMICIVLTSVLVVVGATAKPVERIPIIVGFKDKSDIALLKAHDAKIKYEFKLIRAVACSLPEIAIDVLRDIPIIAYIERDGILQVTPLTGSQTLPWGVERIGANLVHPFNKGTGVKVAIIDTGIDWNHPDLDDNYKGGFDFVNSVDANGDGDYDDPEDTKDVDPMDDNGHGTHVAGIIAAEDNDFGVVGVAPEAHLYAVKVLDSSGSGYVSDVVAGIEWSVTNGMQIISMSLGTTTDYQSLHNACDAAYNSGIVLVAAAGNSGRGWFGSTVYYPARYSSVIAVGATDSNNVRASWSSTGPELELVAPGVSIYSTYWDDTYATLSGTSMACPHVTGTVALVLKSDETAWKSRGYTNGDGDWKNVEVRTVLDNTADDLGAAGRDSLYGYGLVDADEAALGPPLEKESTYSPEGVVITKGTVSLGDHESLSHDDSAYLEVKSVRVGFNQVIDWYSYVHITEPPSTVTSLTITYDGKYSASRTQKLYVYNFASSSWQQIDSRTVDTSDAKITWSTTSPASYISTGREIRLRVYTSARSSFVCYADFASYTIKYQA